MNHYKIPPEQFRKELIEKWRPYLKGVEDPYKQNLMAVTLENVDSYIKGLAEQEHRPVGRFANYAVPLARRVIHDLAVTDLVSVQPMAQPDGKVFFLDFIYKSAYSTSIPNITGGNTADAGENVSNLLNKNYTRDGMTTKGANTRKVALKFSSSPVSATSKKLTGEMFIEDEQDLFTYYGLSGESELLKAMAQQVIREINNYIIDDLLSGATAGNVNFDSTLPTSGAYSTIDPKVYGRKIFDAIVDADNMIFKKRYVTSNWIIASGDVCAYLEKLDDFKADNSPNENQMAVGLYRSGTYRGRWKVYKYGFMSDASKMIVGYKGGSEFETGYVYAPYIPVYTTDSFTDPILTGKNTSGCRPVYKRDRGWRGGGRGGYC